MSNRGTQAVTVYRVTCFASHAALLSADGESALQSQSCGVSISQLDALRSDDTRRQGSSHRLEFKTKLRYSLSKYTSRG